MADPGTRHPRFERLEPTLRQRILDAALREFGRFGYGAASMNRLVEGAGISKGALFKYFGTKAGLFEHVYRSTMEEVKTLLRSVRDQTAGEPFFARLERVLRAGLEFTTSRPLSAAIYYRVIYTGDAPHGNRILAEVQDSSRRFLRGLVVEGVRTGDLRADLDPDRTSFILQSVLDRFLQAQYLEFMALSSGGPSDPSTAPDQWISHIVGLFRDGLVKRP
ncbi:MAG: TetR/AcrR family transcriptional regulator [bacterium]|nr:MAG: TetR/AcrR family transcriptional regulator [bacterium]